MEAHVGKVLTRSEIQLLFDHDKRVYCVSQWPVRRILKAGFLVIASQSMRDKHGFAIVSLMRAIKFRSKDNSISSDFALV